MKTMVRHSTNRSPQKNLGKSEQAQAYISAHSVDKKNSIVEIDMIFVPQEQRRQGEGTRLYEEWEAELPKSVHAVHLFAANTEGEGFGDDENSDDFWSAQGFDYRFRARRSSDSHRLPYEERHTMVKGVNGHPTPKPIVMAVDS